jgi:hypothetical protein
LLPKCRRKNGITARDPYPDSYRDPKKWGLVISSPSERQPERFILAGVYPGGQNDAGKMKKVKLASILD